MNNYSVYKRTNFALKFIATELTSSACVDPRNKIIITFYPNNEAFQISFEFQKPFDGSDIDNLERIILSLSPSLKLSILGNLRDPANHSPGRAPCAIYRLDYKYSNETVLEILQIIHNKIPFCLDDCTAISTTTNIPITEIHSALNIQPENKTNSVTTLDQLQSEVSALRIEVKNLTTIIAQLVKQINKNNEEPTTSSVMKQALFSRL